MSSATSNVNIHKKSWSSIVASTAKEVVIVDTKQKAVPKEAEKLMTEVEIHFDVESSKASSVSGASSFRYSNEVDPDALKVAEVFYGKHLDTLQGITDRRELGRFYVEVMPQESANMPLAKVLFALAKGMKVVNVFNQGKQMEWHRPKNKYRLNTGKSTANNGVRSSVGVGAVIYNPARALPLVVAAKLPDSAVAVAESKSKAKTVVDPTGTPSTTISDELVAELRAVKAEIAVLQKAIETAYRFYDEHTGNLQELQNQHGEVVEWMGQYHYDGKRNTGLILDKLEAKMESLNKQKEALLEKI